MGSVKAKTFRAVLGPDGTRLRWVVARVPFDFAKAWPVRRGRRVRGEINGFAFRTSLFPDARGSGDVLLVNKKMQAGAGVRIGEKATIRLEPDLEQRETLMPAELARALKSEAGLRNWFDAMSPSMRREIGRFVDEPKNPATRQKRALQMAERLLLAKEGEREPPPILRVAFQREPLAAAGWKAMTPAERRGHLLGIFYYQTAEARERRASQAVEEALRVARKGLSG
jgi:uncharacterized protein YdeI (YjbR/CyaY-like superfamily)